MLSINWICIREVNRIKAKMESPAIPVKKKVSVIPEDRFTFAVIMQRFDNKPFECLKVKSSDEIST